jgi:hypothetical protein
MLKQGIDEFRTGKYQDAAGHLGAALSTDFNDPVLHYYLGSTYVRLNQRDGAVREFRIAFALNPDSEAGRLSKQALSMLGVDTGGSSAGGSADVLSLFVIAPAPKPTPTPGQSPQALAELTVAMQSQYQSRLLNPPAGGSDHSNQLQAVAPELRAGATFDESKLPGGKCDGPWYALPNWLAGTWAQSADLVTQTYRMDYKDRVERTLDLSIARTAKPEVWGVMRDRQGAYWEHHCVPDITRNTTSIQVAVKEAAPESSTNRVQIYYRSLLFTLDAKRKIKSVVQRETISTYVPNGTGYCQKTDSVKEFDELGAPLVISKYRSALKLVAPPKVAAKDAAGHDYLVLFRKYLTDNQKAYLIP